MQEYNLMVGDRVRYTNSRTPDWVGLEGTIEAIEGKSYVALLVTKENKTSGFKVGELIFPTLKNLELVQSVAEVEPVEAAEADEDAVNAPSHYTQYPGIEVIQLTEHMDFCRGNAVKYLARAGAKDKSKELEDLKKARWYTDRAIKKLEEELSTETA